MDLRRCPRSCEGEEGLDRGAMEEGALEAELRQSSRLRGLSQEQEISHPVKPLLQRPAPFQHRGGPGATSHNEYVGRSCPRMGLPHLQPKWAIWPYFFTALAHLADGSDPEP